MLCVKKRHLILRCVHTCVTERKRSAGGHSHCFHLLHQRGVDGGQGFLTVDGESQQRARLYKGRRLLEHLQSEQGTAVYLPTLSSCDAGTCFVGISLTPVNSTETSRQPGYNRILPKILLAVYPKLGFALA